MALGEFAYAQNSNRCLAAATFVWTYLSGQVAKGLAAAPGDGV